ncbi:MAG TPA: alpha/beta fold hydrolase [Smithella sp.]|jgi:pimeloyl-ACP methyl ester carboxylesterase|nr:alpha/beta fold hydrolase [Smithella sp.]HOO34526.1 alpha/beta fold hydrolase [Smithella sp.]HOS14423.1 alpha/beta fold hydrolase [Smithella sp.]HPK22128.1 alpha/beta fold hydrolase [Smithella sp.]
MVVKTIRKFMTKDGVRLDISGAVPENARTCLIVWPCMGGAVQMYRVPVEKFTDQGCACILYNPRGHGRSEGELEIQTALNDLDEILQENVPSAIPLVIVGHSAGANASLQFGVRCLPPKQFVLIAPVLDSRESLFYMYQRKTIDEFVSILCAYVQDDTLVRKVLVDDKWLDADLWKARHYTHLLDHVHARMRIGTFLERLFIPGHNAFAQLERFSAQTRIFMAGEDTWYPAATTRRLADKYGIPVETLPEAQNHFFTGAWDSMWTKILNLILLPG